MAKFTVFFDVVINQMYSIVVEAPSAAAAEKEVRNLVPGEGTCVPVPKLLDRSFTHHHTSIIDFNFFETRVAGEEIEQVDLSARAEI